MNPGIKDQYTSARLCAKRVAVGAGTQTFAGIDLLNFIGDILISINHTELSGSGATSIQYSFLDSADNSTFATQAYLPTVAANTADAATIEVGLDKHKCRQYLQIKALTASTTATFDIGAVAFGMKQITP